MRALRPSITAPTKATSTAPTKKYFSTSALFRTGRRPGNRLSNLTNAEGQFRLSGIPRETDRRNQDKPKPSDFQNYGMLTSSTEPILLNAVLISTARVFIPTTAAKA